MKTGPPRRSNPTLLPTGSWVTCPSRDRGAEAGEPPTSSRTVRTGAPARRPGKVEAEGRQAGDAGRVDPGLPLSFFGSVLRACWSKPWSGGGPAFGAAEPDLPGRARRQGGAFSPAPALRAAPASRHRFPRPGPRRPPAPEPRWTRPSGSLPLRPPRLHRGVDSPAPVQIAARRCAVPAPETHRQRI